MADVEKPEGEEHNDEAAGTTPAAAAASQAPAAKKAAVKKKAAAKKKAAPKKKAAAKKKAAPKKKSTTKRSEPAMNTKEAPIQLATSKPRGKLWAAVALWGPLLVIWLLVIVASSPDEPAAGDAGTMTEAPSME